MKRWLLLLLVVTPLPAEEVRLAVLPGSFVAGDVSTRAQIAVQMDEVRTIWETASYGSVRFPYQIAEPYHIGAPGHCDQTWATGAINAAQAAGIVAEKYIMLQAYDASCRYGGEATVGGTTAFINATGSAYVIAHELGHMLGFNHARRIQWSGEVGDFSQARVLEYGDPIDVMAGGNTVSAYERAAKAWLFPTRLGRNSGRVTLQQIDASPSAAVVQRTDGQEYWAELRGAAMYVRSSYYGGSWVATLAPGDSYRDELGGVLLTNSGDLVFTALVPPTPTPGSAATPVPMPTYPPSVETPCWAVKDYLRCSPTPASTPTTAPTARPSLTPPPSGTTLIPTPTVAAATPTVTAADPSPPPVEPSVSPTATAVRPTPSKKSSGCGGPLALLIGGIVSAVAIRKAKTWR